MLCVVSFWKHARQNSTVLLLAVSLELSDSVDPSVDDFLSETACLDLKRVEQTEAGRLVVVVT